MNERCFRSNSHQAGSFPRAQARARYRSRSWSSLMNRAISRGDGTALSRVAPARYLLTARLTDKVRTLYWQRAARTIRVVLTAFRNGRASDTFQVMLPLSGTHQYFSFCGGIEPR